MATLVWRRASGAEQAFSIDGPETTIGRDPVSIVRVDSAYVSKRHAVIRLTARGFTIADLGSSNGTRVNGAPITTAALSDGDTIELGAEKLVFRVEQTTAAVGNDPRRRLVMVGGGATILVGAVAALLLMLRDGRQAREAGSSSSGVGSGATSEQTSPPVNPGSRPQPVVPVPEAGSGAAAVETPDASAPVPDADGGALYDLALAHVRGGRLVEARTLLQRARSLDPANPSVRERLREVEAALQRDVDRRLAEGQRAFTYLRFEDAIGEWEQVVGMTDPGDPRHQQAASGIERARARLAQR
jgi:hypothetical protein